MSFLCVMQDEENNYASCPNVYICHAHIIIWFQHTCIVCFVCYQWANSWMFKEHKNLWNVMFIKQCGTCLFANMFPVIHFFICVCQYIKIFLEFSKVNMWNVKSAQATAFISTHERMFLWKCQSFWNRKCLDLRGTRTPHLRINAECSNYLSYQGQKFAVPCFRILDLVV